MARKAIPGTLSDADFTTVSTRHLGNAGVSLPRADGGLLPNSTPPEPSTIPPCGKSGIGDVPDLFSFDAPMTFSDFRPGGDVGVSFRRAAVSDALTECEAFLPDSAPPGSSMMPPCGKSEIGDFLDLLRFDTPMLFPGPRRLGNVGFSFRRGTDGVFSEYEALHSASGRRFDTHVGSFLEADGEVASGIRTRS